MSKEIHSRLDSEAARSHCIPGVEGNFPLDVAVLEALPEGTKVLSAEPYGNSAWTMTGRVSVILPDGTTKRYFLKCASEEHGRKMMFGEFTSISTIHAILPGLVPAPVGWGKYKAAPPDTYFFLEEYIDMDFSAPEPVQFTARVAEMHRKGTSPNGMFGFPVVTCDGKITHNTKWEASWAVFFSKLLRTTLEIDAEINGRWPELDAAAEQTIHRVIPRLLGILQAEGRTLKPSLIHGDLWGGNVGTSLETGDVILYDAGSYYAHNEMDLGTWRCEWGQYFRAKVYFRNYLKKFEPAEPADEFDDRNRLYCLKYNLVFAGCWPGSVSRQTVLNDMYYLCEKYAPLESLGKYDPQKDPSVTGATIPYRG